MEDPHLQAMQEEKTWKKMQVKVKINYNPAKLVKALA